MCVVAVDAAATAAAVAATQPDPYLSRCSASVRVFDEKEPHQSGKSTPAASRCRLSDTVSSAALACVRAQVAVSEVQALRSAVAAARSIRPSSLESEGRQTTLGSHSRGADGVNACLYRSGGPRGEAAGGEESMQTLHVKPGNSTCDLQTAAPLQLAASPLEVFSQNKRVICKISTKYLVATCRCFR